MSPEMHLILREREAAGADRERFDAAKQLTPATSDLFAAALTALALVDQREAWKSGDGASIVAAVDKCAARDGSVYEWTSAQVQAWAVERGGPIAEMPFEAKGIDGAYTAEKDLSIYKKPGFSASY